MITFPTPLNDLVAAIFRASGSAADEAECVADHLVQANLAGHDSHGIIRVAEYMHWLKDGKVRTNQKLRIVLESDTLVVADGQLGYGQAVGAQAMRLGIERSGRSGTAIVALRNCGHVGRLGHWAEMAAAEGQVSLHFASTNGLGTLAAPLGGVERRLSANPLAVGVPRSGAEPIVLDMATCSIAEGKLKVARNSGHHVPESCIIDAQGNPTTDPEQYFANPPGAILPFGGHKGYGLSVLVEILAGALTGNGCSQRRNSQLEQGMLSIFLDPQRFGTPSSFENEVQQFVEYIKSSALAAEADEILVPGDIESRNRAQRNDQGIEIDTTTWEQLVAEARRLGVDKSLIQCAEQSAC